MGQQLGKGLVCDEAQDFVNLAPEKVERLWKYYALHSDSFCFDADALCRILKVLHEDEDDLHEEKCRALFRVFDTDKNDLIDALEFLATIAASSGMPLRRKLTFCFDLYDFSESGELMLDEVTLLLKSTVTGLGKMSGQTPPHLKEFEDLARLALKLQPTEDGKPLRDVVSTISRSNFCAYAFSNPTLSSWLHHYDDCGAEQDVVQSGFGLQVVPVPEDYAQYKAHGVLEERPAFADDAPCVAKYATLTPKVKVSEGEEAPEAPIINTSRPDASLTLDWVFGFGAPGARGSAAYTLHDDVAFHAAEVAVVRGGGEDVTQHFMRAHDATVTCLAVAQDGLTVATGQSGDAKIVLWDSSTRKVKGVLTSHTGAIALLAFSADGTRLASVDTNNKVCVWDPAACTRISAATCDPCLDLCWTSTQTFVTCGEQGVRFWTAGPDPRKFVVRSGLGGPGAAYTCCACLPSGDLLTTTSSGGFVTWRGRNFLRSVDGVHSGPIACLSVVSGATQVPLLATCEGNRVKIFKAEELELVMELDLTTIPIVGRATTVSLHKSGSKVLVGTSERELYELSALGEGALEPKEEEEGGPADPAPVGELLATIAIGPSGSGVTDFSASMTMVATLDADGIGRDGTVVVFDLENKTIAAREVVMGATCCTLSPDGTSVLVGLGNGTGRVFSVADGAMTQTGVLTPPEPSPEAPAAEEQVEEGDETATVEAPAEAPEVEVEAPAEPVEQAGVVTCRWAGETLALACGNTVHVFGADFQSKGTRTFAAAVTAIDFKADGSLLQVDTSDLDLAFIRAEDGSLLPDRKGRNADWVTNTCPLAYGYKGVLRSLPHSGLGDALTYAASGALCAVGNRFGTIDVLPYPCLEKSSYVTISGHGPGIAGCAFFGEDKFVSAGLTDGCLLAWTVEVAEAEEEAEAGAEEEEAEELGYAPYDAANDANLLDTIDEASERIEAIRQNDTEWLRELEDTRSKDPTAPWKDSVMEGSTTSEPVVPVDDLILEWVHGYSGQAMRGNARYAASGEVVYPAASLGLVLDKTPVAEKMVRTQKVLAVHSNTVTALATTPDGSWCATGEIGLNVLVWSTDAVGGIQGLKLLEGSRASSALAFSPDGAFLACAAQDDEHTVHVFRIGGGLVATAQTGNDKVLDLAFSKDGSTLVYGAANSFGVGTLDGSTLSIKRGLFGSVQRQAVFCCAFIANDEEEKCIVGAASGSLYTLDGHTLGAQTEAHVGPVTTIWSTSLQEGEADLDSVVLVTGGHDGKVKLYSYDLELKLEFDARKQAYGSVDGAVVSACLNRDRRKVLVGTRGSELYEFATNDESDLNKGALVSGHCSGALNAVACHPILPEVASVGDDGYLRTWSLTHHKQLRKLDVGSASRALGFLPNGHEVGVGLGVEGSDDKKAGTVLIISMLKPELEIACTLKDAKDAITCISFSPDGECMAAASADTNIYIYDIMKQYSLKCVCEAHSEIPRTLDYSTDSLRIMSTSQGPSFEMRCHHALNGEVKGLPLDTECQEWTATLGWPVLGAYPSHAASTDITACARSSDAKLLATADESGLVALYRWPTAKGAPAKTFKGHSGQVSMCRFTPSGDYLASVGSDRCLFQWKRSRNGTHAKSKGTLPPYTMAEVPAAPEACENDDPTTSEAPDLVAPTLAPSLTFCYGVPPQPHRVGYSRSGDVVMAVGSKGVIYDKTRHAMQFFSAESLLSAFACSRDGAYGCVSEGGHTLQVFDTETGAHCGSLPSTLKAITHLTFSDDGSQIAGVGVGLRGLLSVATWTSLSGRWEDGVATAMSPIPLTTCGFLCWGGPADLSVGGIGATDAPDLLFCAVRGRNVSQRKTQVSKFAAYSAGSAVGSSLLAGTPAGALELWASTASEAARISETSEVAHAGGVTCICSSQGKGISGGNDGWVKVWSESLECLRSYFVGTRGLSSLAVDLSFSKLACVSNGCLVEIVADSGCATTLLEGDGRGQCGLDEKDGTLCTTGGGGFVRLWSSSTRKLRASFDLTGFPSSACAFAPGESTHLAVGVGSGAPSLDVDGKFYILDIVPDDLGGVSLAKINEGHNAKAWISCAAYSPDGQTLALGCADHVIYLHGVNGGTPYELFAVFDKHEAPIRCLDFASDSSTLRAVCTSNKLLACKAASGDETPLASMEWASQRCPVGGLVAGLLNEDPPVACGVRAGTVVSATHAGLLSARAWPCVSPAASASPAARGHGGPAAAIVYTESAAASAGAYDGCVLQWRVAPATSPPPPPDPVVVTEVADEDAAEEEEAPSDE